MGRDKLGAVWLRRLEHADWAREWWRRIVWQVRDHYDGLGPSGLAQPIPFNLHRAVEDGMIAALRPRTLEFRLEPDRPEEQEDADTAESYVNWAVRATGFVRETHGFIAAQRTDGLGIYKVEYGSLFTPRVDPTTGRAIPGNPDDRDRKDRRVEQREALAHAIPHVLEGVEVSQARHVNTMDFLKSPEEPTLEGSAWAAHRTWIRPAEVEALKAVGFFLNVPCRYFSRVLPSSAERMDRARQRQRTFGTAASEGASTPTGPVENLDEWWEIWEIHDFQEQMIYFVLPGTDAVLRAVPIPPEIEGCAYVAGSPTRNGRTFWTLPYAHHYLPAQDVLDRVVSDAVQNFAKFRKMLLLTNGDIDEGEAQQIAQAVNGEMVRLKKLDPETIKQFDLGGLPPEYLQMIGLLQGIVHRVSGQPELTVGSATGSTATEFAGIQAFHTNRLEAMETDLNDTFAQVAERKVRLAAALAPPEVVVPVIGSTQGLAWERIQERFRVVRKTQLARPFTYHVKVGAGAERMNRLRQSQLLQVWNHLAPMLPPSGQMALATELLYAFDLRPSRILGTGSVPQAVGADAGMGLLGAPPGPGTVIQAGRGAQPGAPTGPQMPMQSADATTRGGRPPQMGPMLTEAMRAGRSRNGHAA